MSPIYRFVGVFLVLSAGLFLLLSIVPAVPNAYTWVISHGSAAILRVSGLPWSLVSGGDGSFGLAGVRAAYVIAPDCTGINTSILYFSALIAYPTADPRKKLLGAAIGIPAFLTFGILRVACLGLVASYRPDLVEIFHVYIMSVANLGFAVFIWIYWFHVVLDDE